MKEFFETIAAHPWVSLYLGSVLIGSIAVLGETITKKK